MPLFTTIIPVYNRPDLVVETIESVLAQRFADHEIIVIDDGSTDSTPAVLERYRGRVRLMRQENSGQGAARNLALAAATGEYACFLDSDDLWHPWMLERLAQAIEQNDRPALVLAAEENFQSGTSPRATDGPLQTNVYPDYLAAWRSPPWLAPSSTAVRADVLRAAGGFFTHRMPSEENDAWLRIADARGFVHILAPVSSARRVHPGNDSAFSLRNVQGMLYILDQEDQEKYPGGSARRRQRQALIAMHTRPLSLACLKQGESSWAWKLFARTWTWNLRLGRFRYFAAFIALGLRARLTPRRRPAVRPT